MAKPKEKEAEAEEKDDKAAEDKADKGKDKKEKEKDKDKKDAPKEGAPAAEGEAAAEGEGEGEAAPKKSKKKIIIIGLAALFVLAGAGAGLYFTGALGKHDEAEAVTLGPDGKPIEKPVYYTLPEFLVNLNTGGKQTSFLKTTVVLEIARSSDVPLIEANLPRLLDACNTYLRELRASDLSGSAGIQRLREELLLRANKTLAPVKVNDVLFKEIIVQ